MKSNRRKFLKSLGATSCGLAVYAGAQPLPACTLGRLEKLKVAAIGFGGRGKQLIGAVNASPSAEIVALADVDEKILNRQNADDKSLFRTQDFRKILDRPDIDIIVSATPNHWHALLTVMALDAGKHVYIEKPISHNMMESQAIVAASERTGKLVQCGFQNRSDTGLVAFYDRLHSGEFGKVKSLHGTCHRPRKTIGRNDRPLKVPDHIDYELWLGPAAKLPIMRPRLHYDWHWDFNTGNGDVGNQGPHEWDLMHWALGGSAQLPTQMVAVGNRFGWNDAGNTPNIMACAGRMSDVPFCFEVMDLKPGSSPPHGRGVGVIIETEKGRFVGGRGGGRFEHLDGKKEAFKRTNGSQDGTHAHMQNFLDAVLANDKSMLRAEGKVAATSSSMAHMANVSYQLARVGPASDLASAFDGSSQQNDMVRRLIDATEVYARHNDVKKLRPWLIGPQLTFDADTEQFVGDRADEANKKMSREYRAGFTFPELAATR